MPFTTSHLTTVNSGCNLLYAAYFLHVLQILLYDKHCRAQLSLHNQQRTPAATAPTALQPPSSTANATTAASTGIATQAQQDSSTTTANGSTAVDGSSSVAARAAGPGEVDCSDQEVYDLAIAHIAEGYTSCWPHHITVADELFALVEALNHEVSRGVGWRVSMAGACSQTNSEVLCCCEARVYRTPVWRRSEAYSRVGSFISHSD